MKPQPVLRPASLPGRFSIGMVVVLVVLVALLIAITVTVTVMVMVAFLLQGR